MSDPKFAAVLAAADALRKIESLEALGRAVADTQAGVARLADQYKSRKAQMEDEFAKMKQAGEDLLARAREQAAGILEQAAKDAAKHADDVLATANHAAASARNNEKTSLKKAEELRKELASLREQVIGKGRELGDISAAIERAQQKHADILKQIAALKSRL
jgi:chromosome segregation protein